MKGSCHSSHRPIAKVVLFSFSSALYCEVNHSFYNIRPLPLHCKGCCLLKICTALRSCQQQAALRNVFLQIIPLFLSICCHWLTKNNTRAQRQHGVCIKRGIIAWYEGSWVPGEIIHINLNATKFLNFNPSVNMPCVKQNLKGLHPQGLKETTPKCW